MPQVMTTQAVVLCPHGGKGTSTASSSLWSVEGGLVLREGDTGVLSCLFQMPCTGYTLRSMGLNATLIDGKRAILATDFNQTQTGLPLTITELHHAIDNSTPSAIPPGQDAPPMTPEMLDMVPPVVTAVPAKAAYSLATQLPPTVPIVFSLSSAFPLKWVLTRVSGPPLSLSKDLTSGDATAVPVPAGGDWPSPSLTVALTLDAAYMTALGMGTHTFYLTGVSRRGLSGCAAARLEVS